MLCSQYSEKQVGSQQVYVPKAWLGDRVLVFWGVTNIGRKRIGEDRMVVTATVEGWGHRDVYERGTGAGFDVGQGRKGQDVVVVPSPFRVLIVA